MIFGIHILLYSENPEADRLFFRDILGLEFVDVGHGWLIFGLPPAEIAVHPTGEDGDSDSIQKIGNSKRRQHAGHDMLTSHVYLMCDDLQQEIKRLQSKRVVCTKVEEAPWGIKTTIRLPSGGEIGLYQPRHETALNSR